MNKVDGLKWVQHQRARDLLTIADPIEQHAGDARDNRMAISVSSRLLIAI